MNSPPLTDALISQVKSVFVSKLAEKVSDFNGLHFLLALTFTISTFSSTKRPFPSVRASPSNRKLLSPITYISEQLHVYYNCDLQWPLLFSRILLTLVWWKYIADYITLYFRISWCQNLFPRKKKKKSYKYCSYTI